MFSILSSGDLSFRISKDDEPYLEKLKCFEYEKLELEVNGGINIDIEFTDKRILFFEKKDKETVMLTLPYHSINRWSATINDVPTSINTTTLSITIYTERNTYEFLTIDKTLVEQINNCLMKHVL